MIEATLMKFARVGFTGSPRENLAPGLRGTARMGFAILFRLVGHDMQVVRIVRGVRDMSKLDLSDVSDAD